MQTDKFNLINVISCMFTELQNVKMYRFAWSFPSDSAVKGSTSNAGDMGSIPGLGRFPGGNRFISQERIQERGLTKIETLVKKAMKWSWGIKVQRIGWKYIIETILIHYIGLLGVDVIFLLSIGPTWTDFCSFAYVTLVLEQITISSQSTTPSWLLTDM